MAEPKKKVNTVRIVVIIVGIIIILLVLLLLFWYFKRVFIIKTSIPGDDIYSYNYTNYSEEGNLPNLNPQDEDIGTPTSPEAAPEDKKREYKTSDKLSEIIFTRVVDYSEEYYAVWKLNINIKVTGYLQEIDPTTSRLNTELDRAYIFKNSNVDYDISGSEIKDDGDGLCKFEYSDVGKGSKPIEQLNVDTGDIKRSMAPAAGWGSWALAYAENGFYTDTPEISLEGNVLFPIVETVTTTKLRDSAICGDYDTKGPVRTMNIALSPTFDLKLINVDINQKSYSGNLEAEENAPQMHDPTRGGAAAIFEQSQLELPIDLPHDAPGNWKVSWKINLP